MLKQIQMLELKKFFFCIVDLIMLFFYLDNIYLEQL